MITQHQLVMAATSCAFCSHFIEHRHPDWCSRAFALDGRRVVVCIPCGTDFRALLQKALESSG